MDSLEFALDREMQRKVFKRDNSIIKEALIWKERVEETISGLKGVHDLIDVSVVGSNQRDLLQRVYILGVNDTLKVDTFMGFIDFIDNNFPYQRVAPGVYHDFDMENKAQFQAKAPGIDDNQLGYVMYIRDFKLDFNAYDRIYLPLFCVIVSSSDFKTISDGSMLVESLNSSVSSSDYQLVNSSQFKKAI